MFDFNIKGTDMKTHPTPESGIDIPARQTPAKTGRRGFLRRLGGVLAATAALPLLPATARTPLASAQTPVQESPPNSGNAFFD